MGEAFWVFAGGRWVTADVIKEALNKSFDKLRMNGKVLIPFAVSLSNHERNPLV
jgi:hypothetical protein